MLIRFNDKHTMIHSFRIYNDIYSIYVDKSQDESILDVYTGERRL